MSKHTSATWRFTKQCEAIYQIERDHGVNQIEVIGDVITEANARLIAAAPDLLEAAKCVIAWYEAEDDHGKEPDFWKRAVMSRESEFALRSAIAKATGEQA